MDPTGPKLRRGVGRCLLKILPVVAIMIGAVGPPMSQATAASEKITATGDTSIRPFKVHVPDAALQDLRQRIQARAAFASLHSRQSGVR